MAKRRKKKKVVNSFMTPKQPSAALAKVVGSKPMPRTMIVKKLWVYIKRKKLQDKKDRTMIVPDETLKAVLKKKKVSMFKMNKLLNRHIKKVA